VLVWGDDDEPDFIFIGAYKTEKLQYLRDGDVVALEFTGVAGAAVYGWE
jgi:hypothetical protein